MDVMIRIFFALLAAALLLPQPVANAQRANVRKVGVILQGGSWYDVLDGLKDGLRSLGFVEGKQFVLDIRDMHGDLIGGEREA